MGTITEDFRNGISDVILLRTGSAIAHWLGCYSALKNKKWWHQRFREWEILAGDFAKRYVGSYFVEDLCGDLKLSVTGDPYGVQGMLAC